MLQAMNYGAKIAILGIPAGEVSLDLTQIILKGLTLKGVYGREMFETWYKMTSMLQSNLDISQVITHRFAWDDFQLAFEAMRAGQTGKVILDWQ
jgi:threonine 3-dehydrogenase